MQKGTLIMDRFFRPYVTKFFEANDLHFLQEGSLRIGTLKWYADEENRLTQGARLDTGEGHFSGTYEHSNEWVQDVDLPGILIEKGAKGQFQHASFGNTLNAYVLCSSIGSYTTELHRSLVCPSENGYPGNSKLTGFVTFDTYKLMEALSEVAMRTFKLPLSCKEAAWLHYSPVQYGSRHRTEQVVSGQKGLSWNPIYTKPPLFRPENEFRITLNKDFPSNVQPEAEPFNLKGPEILEAMCFLPMLVADKERDRWLNSSKVGNPL